MAVFLGKLTRNKSIWKGSSGLTSFAEVCTGKSGCTNPRFAKLHTRSAHSSTSHTSAGSWRFGNGLRSYWVSLRWFSIPASVGFAYICYQQYRHIKKREQRKILTSDPIDLVADQWMVSLYKKLPLRVVSRAWGKVNDIELPVWLRGPIIGLYAWKFSCNLAEAIEEDIQSYPNLGAFFTRQLKPEARPVDLSAVLTSPTDGCMLHCGEVSGNVVEQVKGVTYSVSTFLGPGHPAAARHSSPENGKRFYHCIIYLAPGDYHSFHSPADWNVEQRRHFPGELLSVHPGVQRIISGLFNHNERVVMSGSWEHGYFAYAAVGATNVGSIYINFDQGLRTNQPRPFIPGSYSEITYTDGAKQGMALRRGEQIGGFKLGSTIVLFFEAPDNFKFCVEPGQTIKYGERLGTIISADKEDTAMER